MVDFKKYLQQSKDMKFNAISSYKENKPNPYSCNYCPKNHHKFCEHPGHCIFDPAWIEHDSKVTKLRNQLRKEEEYLRNGEGTYGYDRVKVYKNVLRLKKKLKECDMDVL